MPETAKNWLLYDGECPFCSRYVRHVRLRERARWSSDEGRGGERTIVRLGAGGEIRSGAYAPRRDVNWDDELKEKEERQARRIRQIAEDKLRALGR